MMESPLQDTESGLHHSYALLLGAMDEEVNACLELMADCKSHHWNGFSVYVGRIDDRNAIVCKTGVGKVYAAAITQRLLDIYPVNSVIFCGVAGAVHPDLAPGDVVLGRQLVQYDMDASALGFEIGQVPFTSNRYFQADAHLLKLAESVQMDSVKVRSGTIGTADRFLTDRQSLPLEGIDCVDMEGCAVAQVCTLNNIPFVVIRTITDSADGRAKLDFAKNLPLYASRSAFFIRTLLRGGTGS